MKKTLLFTFILFFIIGFGQNQNLDWKLTTPFLRTEAVKKMEIISDQCFLAQKTNIDNDLIITEDNGKTWRQINDFSLSVRDFTVKNNKGYALIGPGLRVTDQKFSTPGTTYTLPVTLTNSIFVLNDNTIFIGTTNSKIMKTTNGGVTWSTYSVPTVYSDKIMGMFFTTPDTGFCVTGSSSGDSFIFKTSDGGQTWLKVNTSTAKFSKILFKNALNGIAVSSDGITKYTLNGGDTWSDAAGISYLYDIQLYNNEYIAVGSPNKFYKTATGESWVNSIIYPTAFNVYKSLAVHANFILAGSNNESGSNELRHTILKTSDLINWNPMDIKWIDAGNLYKEVYVSQNLSIVPFQYFSVDKGYKWDAVKNNFPAGAMHILPNGKGIAIGRGTSQFFLTNDNGINWTSALSPATRLAIPAMKPNGDYAITNMGTNADNYTGFVRVYSSSTGWSAPANVESEVKFIKFVTNDIGFLVNNTKIMRTMDGGITWSPITTYNAPLYEIRNIVVGNANRIYFGHKYTTDYGNTFNDWNNLATGFKDYEIFDDGTGYGIDSSRDVFKTINYGNSWQKIVATQLLITPGGSIQKIAFAKNYMVATGPDGFYVLDFANGNLSTNDIRMETGSKVKMYPNPTTGNLYFDMNDKVRNIKIFDISGRIFIDIENPETNSVDILNLKTGNYFVRIVTENKIYLEKVIKK